MKNTIIGAGMGLSLGGGVVSVGGVFLTFGYGTVATVGWLGVTAPQTFAIGALVFDVSAILASAIGIETEPLEYPQAK